MPRIKKKTTADKTYWYEKGVLKGHRLGQENCLKHLEISKKQAKALIEKKAVIVPVEPSDLKIIDLADVFLSLWVKLNRNDVSVAKAIRILYKAMIKNPREL